MKGELIINGSDAFTSWGVSMGDNFINSLKTPPQMKDYVECNSRTEDGKRMVVIPMLDSRDVTLTFTIQGVDKDAFQRNEAAFLSVLQAGKVNVRVPALDRNTYKLIYTGKSNSYSLNRLRNFAKFTAKFVEPNPTDR